LNLFIFFFSSHSALTVEEIFQDREKFADEVLETAVADVASMG